MVLLWKSCPNLRRLKQRIAKKFTKRTQLNSFTLVGTKILKDEWKKEAVVLAIEELASEISGNYCVCCDGGGAGRRGGRRA